MVGVGGKTDLLIRFAKHSSQGKVEHVRSRVVAHAGTATLRVKAQSELVANLKTTL
jgi:hypothetical protein